MELLWRQTYDLWNQNADDEGNSLVETDDGGFVVGGRSTPHNSEDRFIGLKVDQVGRLLWSNLYGMGRPGVCYSVLETKAGAYLFSGYLGEWGDNMRGYAVMVNSDGNIIWEHCYDDIEGAPSLSITAEREVPDGGFIFAGSSTARAGQIFMTDAAGNLVWSQLYPTQNGSWAPYRGMVSTPSGYAVSRQHAKFYWENNDTTNIRFELMEVNRNGDMLWRNYYILDHDPENYSLARLSDGGFLLTGTADIWWDQAALVKTDRDGNLAWIRRDNNTNVRGQGAPSDAYFSVIQDNLGYAVATGFTLSGNREDGVIVKIVPERSAPRIIFWSPHNFQQELLRDDSLNFMVRAVDIQNDSLRYVWRLDEDTVATDSTCRIQFSNLGMHTVRCSVSDGELADSLTWHVSVRDLLIIRYTPDSLNLVTRHAVGVNFSIDSVAVHQGNDVEYRWSFKNLQTDHSEDAGAASSANIVFPRGGRYGVEAMAFSGEARDTVIWNVSATSTIRGYGPEDLNVTIPLDTSLNFWVIPSNSDSGMAHYAWNYDHYDTWIDSSDLAFQFPELGNHTVGVVVTDSADADTLEWTVRVNANANANVDPPLASALALALSPNPFNSRTTISYSVHSDRVVRLTVHDLTGRLVIVLATGRVRQGRHSLVFEAGGLGSGIYWVVLEDGGHRMVHKAVLMK